MRRPARILLTLMALLLLVAACGGDEEGGATTAAPGDTTAAPADTTAAPADTTAAPADTTAAPEETTTTAGGPSGDPIVVGSTLPLTGPFAATGNIHRIAGQQFVDQLNASGGLLGRPVEWRLLDDESVTDNVATLYEQLISQDGVDLLIGPYATPNIMAAMPIAERHGYVLPQHTAVLAPTLTYACQFPAWSIGYEPNVFIPNQLADAIDSLEADLSTVALVTNESGSVAFVTGGRPDVDEPAARTILPERGYEIVADLSYPPGTPPGDQAWDAIAASLQAADPDVVMLNGLGVDANALLQAGAALDYAPRMLYVLFPAPGPLLSLEEAAEGVLTVGIFVPNEEILASMDPVVTDIVNEFAERASAEDLFPIFETQAAASWNAWEILTQGVETAGSLDNQAICDALHDTGANLTFGGGPVIFDPAVNNFWDTNLGIIQVQGGELVMAWPPEQAAGELQGPTS